MPTRNRSSSSRKLWRALFTSSVVKPVCDGGKKLEFVCEAGPGDFIYVPPYVPHQEINANSEEPLECILVRSDQEPLVVNLDIPVVETQKLRIDPIHADIESQD